MDKVHNALRRSTSRLKSMKSGHESLHKIISDVEHMKYSYEMFIDAQNSAWENMSKWAAKERNVALLETFQHLFQLSCIWTEVQREYVGNIKKFKQQFKKILESELHLDKCKTHLKHCEQKELELRKKENSLSDSSATEKLRVVKGKVLAAQAEVNYKTLENENVKMITVKQGLNNFSESYVEVADKMSIVHNAQNEIAKLLPDVENQDLQDVRFVGSEMVKQTVLRARERILFYRPYSQRVSAPPPPYAVNNPAWQNISFNGHNASFEGTSSATPSMYANI